MKKIKRIAHLQKEKQRLRRRREDLEPAIRHDWQNIIHSLAPVSLAKDALVSCTTWIGKKILPRSKSEKK